LRRKIIEISAEDQPPTQEPATEEQTPPSPIDPQTTAAIIWPDDQTTPAPEHAHRDAFIQSTGVAGPPGKPSPPRPKRQFEEQFVTQWMVWLGAVTVAIGSIFLVKYSIDQELLSPGVRVTLGGLFGLGLIGFGEWLRRRPLQRAFASLQPNNIPSAITAAGLFAAMASGYTAYALYSLINPFAAFILMAALAGLALGLSILQGPFVALLGLVAGYSTPMRFDRLAAVAAIAVILAIALWHLPSTISIVGPFYEIEGRAFGRAIGPILPPELLPFLITTVVFGALFLMGGFAAVCGARRSIIWAGVSAATPLVLMVAAYWRAADFAVDFTWGFAAISLAAIALLACLRLQKFREVPSLNEALGIFAAAVIAAISLTATMTLREAWLNQ
jgi:uncharacterized membrane protein